MIERNTAGARRMIRVATVGRRDEQDIGARCPELRNDLEAVPLAVLDVAVGNPKVHTPFDTQDPRCIDGFLFPILGRSARSELPTGQVHDPHTSAAGHHGGQRTTAAELHVIRMRAESHGIELGKLGHGREGIRGCQYQAQPTTILTKRPGT